MCYREARGLRRDGHKQIQGGRRTGDTAVNVGHHHRIISHIVRLRIANDQAGPGLAGQIVAFKLPLIGKWWLAECGNGELRITTRFNGLVRRLGGDARFKLYESLHARRRKDLTRDDVRHDNRVRSRVRGDHIGGRVGGFGRARNRCAIEQPGIFERSAAGSGNVKSCV